MARAKRRRNSSGLSTAIRMKPVPVTSRSNWNARSTDAGRSRSSSPSSAAFSRSSILKTSLRSPAVFRWRLSSGRRCRNGAPGRRSWGAGTRCATPAMRSASTRPDIWNFGSATARRSTMSLPNCRCWRRSGIWSASPMIATSGRAELYQEGVLNRYNSLVGKVVPYDFASHVVQHFRFRPDNKPGRAVPGGRRTRRARAARRFRRRPLCRENRPARDLRTRADARRIRRFPAGRNAAAGRAARLLGHLPRLQRERRRS